MSERYQKTYDELIASGWTHDQADWLALLDGPICYGWPDGAKPPEPKEDEHEQDQHG